MTYCGTRIGLQKQIALVRQNLCIPNVKLLLKIFRLFIYMCVFTTVALYSHKGYSEGVLSPDIMPSGAYVNVSPATDFDFGTGSRYTLIKVALDPDADPAHQPEFIIDLLGDNSANTQAILTSPSADSSDTPLANGLPIYTGAGGAEVSKVLWLPANRSDKVYSIVLVHVENSGGGLSAGRHWQIKIKNTDTSTRKFYVGVAHTTANTFPLGPAIVDAAEISYAEHDIPISIQMRGIIGTGTINKALQVCNRGTGQLTGFNLIPAAGTGTLEFPPQTIDPASCQQVELVFTPSGDTAGQIQKTFQISDEHHATTDNVTITAKSEKLELVLALDISGSMGWLPSGSGNNIPAGAVPPLDTRLGRLKPALQQFINHLYQQSNLAQFSLATVVFPPTVDAVDPVAGAELTRPMTLLTSVSETTLTGEADEMAIGNWHGTPMGEAIRLSAEAYSENDFTQHHLLMFSDGDHNTGINPEDSRISGSCFSPGSSDGVIQDKEIFIHSIAYGTDNNINHGMLTNLSDCSGVEGDIFSDPGLVDTTSFINTLFDKVLIGILDDQLDYERDPIASITAGETQEYIVPLTELDRYAIFSLSWTPPLTQEALDIQLVSPTGTIYNPTTSPDVKFREGATYKTIYLGGELLSEPENIGDWLFRIRYPQEIDAIAKAKYSYNIMLSSQLKMKMKIDKNIPHTGDNVVVEVRLRDNGLPVLNTDVNLTLKRPSDGLGNWFSLFNVTPSELEKIPTTIAGENLTLLQRKSRYLRQIKGIKLPDFFSQTEIKLYDDRTHGDKKAGDGIYTNSVTLKKEGIHSFLVKANGSTSNGNMFKREAFVQKYVTVNLDPDVLVKGISITEAKALPFFPEQLKDILQQPVRNGYVRRNILFTPKDSNDNFLGPGYADKITFTLQDATAIGPVVEMLGGTYAQVIEQKFGDRPTVSVSVRGVETKEKDILDSEVPVWFWLWTLVLTLIL